MESSADRKNSSSPDNRELKRAHNQLKREQSQAITERKLSQVENF